MVRVLHGRLGLDLLLSGGCLNGALRLGVLQLVGSGIESNVVSSRSCHPVAAVILARNGGQGTLVRDLNLMILHCASLG